MVTRTFIFFQKTLFFTEGVSKFFFILGQEELLFRSFITLSNFGERKALQSEQTEQTVHYSSSEKRKEGRRENLVVDLGW